jgi:hypothetical protein
MTYRVVQWATGNVGRHAIKAILDHPDLELVGVHVTSPAKAGQDAGELVGREPVGVLASADLDELLALDADCVAHMPLPSKQVGDDPDRDTKDICTVLASGKNVVTTVGYVYPKAYGKDVVDRLDEACAAGGSSLHGTGLNPGFMAELIPLVLSGLSARIDQVYVRESSEFSRYPSPEIILGMMGFGKAPAEYDVHSARYRAWLGGLFAESVGLVADGLGVELDGIETTEEVELTEDRLEIAAGVLDPGTVAAQRWEWRGMVGAKAVVVLEAVYKAAPQVAPAWPGSGWLTRIDGDPRITVDVDRWIGNGLLATAMHAVHAIPAVVDAAPGIRTFLDLPLIVGRGTVRV